LSLYLRVVRAERLDLGKKKKTENVIHDGRGTNQLSNWRGKLPHLAEKLRAEAEATASAALRRCSREEEPFCVGG